MYIGPLDLHGFHICDTDFVFLKHGHYAAVFHSKAKRKVRKVYFKHSDLSDQHVLDTFELECEAYKLAAERDDLKDLIPRDFQLIEGLRVCDPSGDDASGTFFPGCAFETEHITGPFQKINQVRGSENIKALFRKHGITGINDADVTLIDGEIAKVVDFSIREIEIWHD